MQSAVKLILGGGAGLHAALGQLGDPASNNHVQGKLTASHMTDYAIEHFGVKLDLVFIPVLF